MFATGRIDSKANILFAELFYGWQVKNNFDKEGNKIYLQIATDKSVRF